MLAVLTRSSALSIGIGVGVLLVVEGLITIVAPGSSSYLSGGTLNTLATGGNNQLSWGASLGLGHPLRRHRHNRLSAYIPHPRHHVLTRSSG